MSSQMSSSQVLRNVYTESLSSLTSVISLAEHLSKHQYISVDTVDRVTMLEGEGAIGVSQGKELIVDILVTLGPAKVADVKKTLRDFVKSSRKVRPNLDELDVKLPPSLAPVVNGIEKEPEKESEPKIKEKEHKRSKKIPKTETEDFDGRLYVLLRRLISSYEKSETIRSRLTWLDCDISLASLKQYFDDDISVSGTNVSLVKLLEDYKQLMDRRKEQKRKDKARERIRVLDEELKVKEKKIEEILQVNDQWRLECEDLKAKIESLQNVNSVDDLAENQEIVKLEKQDSSGEEEDYKLLLNEKATIEEKLLEVTEERELLVEQLSVLRSEFEDTKTEMKALKTENEELKNENEEMKDRVGNLKLNLKAKEPSVREMSLLLETNRKLQKQLDSINSDFEKEKTSFANALRSLRAEKNHLSEDLEREKAQIEKEKEELETKLVTTKDEMLALRTYIKDLEEEKKRPVARSEMVVLTRSTGEGGESKKGKGSNSNTGTSRLLESGRDPLPPRSPSPEEPPLLSFSSQQRVCPGCSKVLKDLSDKEFIKHISDCFN